MRFLGLAIASFALMAFDASAHSRSGLVYKSGQVHLISPLQSGSALLQADCEGDPDLLFRFTESVSSEHLRIEAGQGSIVLDLHIDLACQPGNATFEYGHERNGGFSDDDVRIVPDSPVLGIPLHTGASTSVVIEYGLLNRNIRSATARLVGSRITFVVDGTFGQTSQRRELATITFLGSVLDEGLLDSLASRRVRDAGRALNEACRSASPESEFAHTCREIREHAVAPERQLQAANAFDAHGLAATPQAAGESGRIQFANVADRLAELRSGQRGVSAGGLSFAVNGQSFDQSWLPASLRVNEDEPGSRLLGDQWGVFVNGNISIGSRSERGKEVGFDFDSWGLTTGLDYRFRDGAFAGLAIGYSKYDADIDDDGGSLDGDTYSVQLFGSIDIADNLYVDLTAGYARTDFDQVRVVDLSGIGNLTRQISRGSTSSDQVSASAAINYRRVLDNGLTLTPYGQLYWADVSIDGFAETGSVFSFEYPDQSFTSQLWSAGLRASRAFSLERGILSPFADLSYQYQGGIDSYTILPVVGGMSVFGPEVEISDPDRSVGRLDLGLSWVFPTGNQMFASYSALLFDRDTTLHSFFLGARWEF